MLQRSNSTNTITGVKEILTQVSGDTKNNYVSNSNFYVNTHPENNPVLIPFINNDIAFMLKRGGSVNIYYDGVEKSIDISNVFDGSPSYWAMDPTGTTEIIIILNLHKLFTWNNTIYCDFGSAGWRAKNVKIEVINTNYQSDVWTEKYNNTNNGAGNVFITMNHTPVGASNAGGGFNKVRFTFKTWNSATIFRIAQLGIYNFGSYGSRETSMSRGIDDYVFRSITPNSNNTYNLGSSANKWNTVYGTTFSGNSSSASKLIAYTSRQANINTEPTGDGGLIKFNASSITNVGRPPAGDANIIQMNWDTTGGWDCQLSISTSEIPELEFRNQRNKVWGNWKRLLRKDDMASSTNDGVMSKEDKNKIDNLDTTYYKATNPNGYTSNTGTVTSVAVKMNGSTKGTITTSGTIDLGTVITAHQDISGKQNTLIAGPNIQISGNNVISATQPTKTSDLTNDSHFIKSDDSTVTNVISLTKNEYDALVSKSTNTLYNITDDYQNDEVKTGSGVIDSNYIQSIENNHYEQIGHVVTYSFTMNVKGTWTSTTRFVSGLPKPISPLRFLGINHSGNTFLRLQLTANGEIQNGYSNTVPSNNATIEGYVSYITNDI